MRARIGQLIDGRDLWWNPAPADAADDIADKVANHVLPFFEQMHSVDAMVQFLEDGQVLNQRHPPPITYLAILRYEQGDARAACALLADLQRRDVGAWRPLIRRVSAAIEGISASPP